MKHDTLEESPGDIGRRTVLRRSALIGGAMVWSVPTVQALAGPALAGVGSPGAYACAEVLGRAAADGSGTASCFLAVGDDASACSQLDVARAQPTAYGQLVAVMDLIDSATLSVVAGPCTPPSSP